MCYNSFVIGAIPPSVRRSLGRGRCSTNHAHPPGSPSNSSKIFPSLSVTFSPTVCLPKPFRCNTYESPRKYYKQRTYAILNFFRCNTYKKQGGGGQRSSQLFQVPYVLPSSVSCKSCICHSCENCRGGYQQFPFWNFKPPILHFLLPTEIRPDSSRFAPRGLS
jgi:hypothetical protein